MHHTVSATQGRRAIQIAVLGLVTATAATVGMIVIQPGATPASSSAGSPAGVSTSEESSAQTLEGAETQHQDPPGSPELEANGTGLGGESASEAGSVGVVTQDDGLLPAGATVFDDGYAGIAKLRPELLRALQAAAADARDHGIEFVVNSGWRSAEYQERLLRDAIADHGSLEAAARWVATPQTSAHVSGDAVDIDGAEAPAWLSAYGAAYGLCQTYGNEPWHFELISRAVVSGCPAMYSDPTEDPRMQQ